ncbi:nucleotidyl transferase AbiEii/AbiGii toxin family protein [Echinicola soli]|uniref:Nucleotidyl transferase AbiEii/AbiGii toxin family protein n=1 Tax=Echinicola soli TaxID=2591634 RepID=A0A514CMX8_9BACT|nr:nucleotidyl transferase AbiEii/AbiGii toxin family protein [Echinicola soli]QDH81175.1 nucleotidyl transferase AbiEii/AbiGii toxin family protein [Echinicola soli]
MLYYNTVNKLLLDSLKQLMAAEPFDGFRLVGGTALSLQIGHRESVDIDLFSDVEYGAIDFDNLHTYLENHFPFIDHLSGLIPAFGKSYIVGQDPDNTLKLDIFYTDPFIQPELELDSIRMATIEEIIAMKLDVVQRGGRKKDFWDLHELLNCYSIEQMLELHESRYPYTHERELILHNFTDFSVADEDFDPICLLGKYWPFIKEDITEMIIAFKENE